MIPPAALVSGAASGLGHASALGFIGARGSGQKEWLASPHPVGRVGAPREVAVDFLRSPAASFLAGRSLPADGGWLAL